jgi:protein TonB
VAAPSQPQAELKPAAKSTAPEHYPYEAVRRGIEGEAWVAVTLDARGRVIAARLERGSGHAILDEAAVRAARSLKSVPAGAGETVLPVTFRLK